MKFIKINFPRLLFLYSSLAIAAIVATLIFYKPQIVKERKEARERVAAVSKEKKIPPYLLDLPKDYDWLYAASLCMERLRNKGPTDYIPDRKVNCQDWAATFLWLWYMEFKQPAGTCLFVWNLNANVMTDEGVFWHAFVAVRTRDSWICLEPQARFCDDWSLEAYWKNLYDPSFNVWGDTKSYIKKMDIDKRLQRQLIDKTKTEYFYGYDY